MSEVPQYPPVKLDDATFASTKGLALCFSGTSVVRFNKGSFSFFLWH